MIGAAAARRRRNIQEVDPETRAAIMIQARWKGKIERRKFLANRTAKDRGLAVRLRSARVKLWYLLEDPTSSRAAQLTSAAAFSTIVLSLVAFVVETVPEVRLDLGDEFLDVVEAFCTVVFTLEYCLRLSVCTAVGDHAAKFFLSWLNFFDLLAILPWYIEMNAGGGEAQVLRVARATRLFRVFRIFKFGRYSQGMRIVGEALMQCVQALWVLVFFVCIGVVLFSSILFYLERFSCPFEEDLIEDGTLQIYTEDCLNALDGFSRQTNLICCDLESRNTNVFPTISSTFWWALVTLTTVGYGDSVPLTWQGRMVAACAMLSGILLIALPVAIVGRKFQDVYDATYKKQHASRHKHILAEYHPPPEDSSCRGIARTLRMIRWEQQKAPDVPNLEVRGQKAQRLCSNLEQLDLAMRGLHWQKFTTEVSDEHFYRGLTPILTEYADIMRA